VSDLSSEELGFVGRESQIANAVEALRSERCRGLVIRGGPASGSSSFAHAVARQLGGQLSMCANRSTAGIAFGVLHDFVPPGSSPDLDVATLGAVVERLRAVVGDDPAPVVVDGAAFLDAGSAASFAHLLGGGVPLVLVLDRCGGLPTAIADRAGDLEFVDLVDLDDAAISQLASLTLGGPVEPRVIRSLTRLVGGASDAVHDVIVAAVQTGTVVLDGGVWRQRRRFEVPATTQARLIVHLEGLGPVELDGLDVLALGRRVPIEVIESVVGATVLVVLEARNLIEIVSLATGTAVRVVDAVVGSARLAQIGQFRRRILARRLADALSSWIDAQANPERVWDDAVVAASVRLAAGNVPSVDEAMRAAHAARSTGDLALAIELCEAIESQHRSIDLTIQLTELLTETGRNREAESLLRTVDGSTDRERALVVMARAVNLGFHLDEVDEAMLLLDAGIAELADGPWAAEVIGLRGVFELMLGRPLEAIRRVEPYLSLPDGREFVEAAIAAGPALVAIGHCEQAAELAQRSLDERMRLGDQAVLESAGLHAVVRGFGLAEAGRFAEADDLTGFVLSAATDMAIANGVMWAGIVRGRSMLDQGRFPEAVELFQTAASAALDLNLGLHLSWARGGALLAASQMGDADVARRAFDALRASPPTRLGFMASEVERARAWSAIVAGDLRSAVRSLSGAAERSRSSGESGLEVLALHDLVRVGRRDVGERLAELADSLEGPLNATRVAHGVCFGLDDADGLATVSGEFESLGALVLAAEAMNQASWVARRGGSSTKAERLRDRAQELHDRRPFAATPALEMHPAMVWLTAREREVVALAASARTSKEIGRHLGVSVRTVDNLLQRAYRKLDVSGRADLREIRSRR